jgi:hypothetical protein
MPENFYDEDSESMPAPAAPAAEGETKKSEDTTAEAKLGLVPASFFKGPVRPGDREMVEVVDVYDDEVSIKCVYGEEEEEEEMAPEEPGLSQEPARPAEDEMMT